jgi:hypothetical protein
MSWHLHSRFVKISRNRKTKERLSTKPHRCPGCEAEDVLSSQRSRWLLWRKENPNYTPFQTEIACPYGTISSIRFTSVKNVPARGVNRPYIVVAHFNDPIPVKGDFTTVKNLILTLSRDCTSYEGNYLIRPFDVVVTTSQVILYKLSTVQVQDNPLVSVNIEKDYGVLSPNVNFSAYLTYTDPLLAKH